MNGKVKKGIVGSFMVLVLGVVLFSAGPANAAGMLIADGGWGGVLEIREHEVNVTINNGIAVTEVTQVFYNTERRQVEALYTFPVPKKASVSNFSMWIGGKEMIGEVVEKDKARQIYESYKQQRRDPGLLEQTDYKTFEMRIFPIAAESEQKVQITYYQELDIDNDFGTYVYPLATVTKTNIRDQVENKFSFNMEVKSEIPIVEMESPSHGDDFIIADHRENYYQASLESSGGILNRDIVVAYKIQRPVTGVDIITSRTGREEGFFCMTITAGEELSDKSAGQDYIFVLDISGSMANDSKLTTSRNSLGAFINGLGEKDRFEVITFNVTPNTLFNQLRDVSTDSKEKASDFLRSQKARGGTVLHSAITTAYKYSDPDRSLNVVVLSDGMTEQQEREDLLSSIQEKPSNAKIFCIGVGNEVNRQTLQDVAEETGGLAAFLSQGDDFERQAKAFRRKLMHPVMTNLSLDFSGGTVYDLEPSKLPNLFHGTPVRIYGRYKGNGTVDVKINGEVEGAPVEKPIEIDFPKEDNENPEIERMWAWHKIQRLMKDAKSNQASVDEIVRLGEGFSIASEYTSFIVLENDAEYKRWKIEQKNSLRLERDRRSQNKVKEELEKLRKKSLTEITPINGSAEAEKKQIVVAKNTNTQPMTTSPGRSVPSRSTTNRQSWDLHLPTNGGGALDPITSLFFIGLAGVGAMAAFRKH